MIPKPPTKSWDLHRHDVHQISEQLQQAKAPVTWCRGKNKHPHATRRQSSLGQKVSTSQLTGILGMDGNSVWAEAGVTMEQLSQWTLSRGLIPSVVPEFKGITVGGAIMGAALESSSFREGQFNDCCSRFELLLGNGQIVQASANEHSELFYGVSGSYGSIASISSARIRLVPAKAIVRLSYHLLDDYAELASKIDALTQQNPCYLDGVVLDSKRTVLITGYTISADEVPRGTNIRNFNAYWKPWFIQHVIEKVADKELSDDFLPIYDYLFRFDRAAFWMGQFCTNWRSFTRFATRYNLSSPKLGQSLKNAEAITPPTVTPSLLFRLTCGWLLSSSGLYKALHRIPTETLAQRYLVQDFYVPTTKLDHFLQYVAKEVQIQPLWLCPMKGTRTPQFLSPHYSKESRSPLPDFVNVGVYGSPKSNKSVPAITRELEALVHKLDGRKMLYALSYVPEEEFWQTYDRAAYNWLREISGAKSIFRDVYAKTHPTAGALHV